ncbi:hypothetical protein E0765_11250 [Sulfuricurvum sp. IAE1]|jgi:hypothetical protein|uniref:hypothetical protein n=1 Tax=Sulfuricurvum sp. IAE1 TaxID=2546102 RepID=UPI00104E3E6B|nr:hypothetical protein [Sulfuricurvum sp. IAE1]MDD3769841.1 hypothetical protein [Sulfuricurvum sp.]MDX9965814.1 hypothetical protein [Sulfuricurvum sp.]TDA62386.1 hypothetical protein E0765_11250 [Sulfuricurvum sp. IAE1]
MLTINETVIPEGDEELGDNLLYYDYNIDHILSLEAKGLTMEDEGYVSAYRSFEGEVYENYIYEKLLRFAANEPKIKSFIIKGPHKHRTRARSDALSVSWKGQIIYRARHKEIGEFDGLLFTDRELYFVEMTLVKSVSNLKKRLRKKRALLEVLFPRYKVKALLVLNEGATGTSELPDYASVWITKPYSARHILDRLSARAPRAPMRRVESAKIAHAEEIKTASFKYYATLTWMLRSLRGKDPIDLEFFRRSSTQRYHDIYTKVYVGYLPIAEFKRLAPGAVNAESKADRAVVAIEKDHSGGYFLTYFVRHSAKKLDNVTLAGGACKIVKKDPFGITLTEMNHLDRVMGDEFLLTPEQHSRLEALIPTIRHK